MGKPWEDVPDVWKDERAYCNWLRSQIRRAWSRHPIKTTYVKNRRVPKSKMAKAITSKFSANAKFFCDCEMCGKWQPQSYMEVDHIHGGTGFSTYEGFLVWQKTMLFLGFEDIQHLCKPCHADVTLSQKLGCTLEEVPMQRERIDFGKLKAKGQIAKLKKLGLPEGRNSDIREANFLVYLKEKYNG